VVDELEAVAEGIEGVEAADPDLRVVIDDLDIGGLERGPEACQVVDHERHVRLAGRVEVRLDAEMDGATPEATSAPANQQPPRPARAGGLGTSVRPSNPP
jgi:hypothetical protein